MAALVLSTAAALSIAYWSLHWQLPSSPALPATAAGTGGEPVDGQALAKALGGLEPEAAPSAPPATEASRFVLQGVVGNSSTGSALIAIDGKPPKPVRVGSVVAEGWVLHLVEGRRAMLRNNAAELELSLPALPVPATLSKKVP